LVAADMSGTKHLLVIMSSSVFYDSRTTLDGRRP
jgi:hypothetical protein